MPTNEEPLVDLETLKEYAGGFAHTLYTPNVYQVQADIDAAYKVVKTALSPKEVYILWRDDADNWNSVPHFDSVHATIESARLDIPDNIRGMLARKPHEPFIEDYTYFMISKMEVKNNAIQSEEAGAS